MAALLVDGPSEAAEAPTSRMLPPSLDQRGEGLESSLEIFSRTALFSTSQSVPPLA